MKIDVTQKLMSLMGEPLKDGDKEVTLRDVSVTALLNANEQSHLGDAKARRWQLARQITDNDSPDIKAEDITLIKELAGKQFTPVVIGPMYELLEGRKLHVAAEQ